MNASEAHDEFDQLLPLYANGSLDAHTRARLADHLAECTVCREELAFLGTVRDTLRQEAARAQTATSGGNFDSLPMELRSRITASPAGAQPARWKRIALAASILAVLALGVVLTVPQQETPHFRTATVATLASDSIIIEVRFRTQAGADEVGRLLRDHRAVVLHGPQDEHRWTLEVPVSEQQSAEDVVATLRRNAGVAEVRLLETRHR